jgi:opacity protein-like surface antigen
MNRRNLLWGIGLVALLLPAQAHAQRQANWGVQLSVAQETNVGIGARFDGSLGPLVPAAQRWRFQGSFDYFFPDGALRYWEMNGDLAYHFPVSSRLVPYAGAGLGIAHTSVAGVRFSGNTDVGVNLLGGLKFPTLRGPTPYLQMRFELGGGEQFVLTGGLLLF